jgi:hypothetical protein
MLRTSLAFLLLATPASAELFTGNKLNEWCTTKKTDAPTAQVARAILSGYVAGLLDAQDPAKMSAYVSARAVIEQDANTHDRAFRIVEGMEEFCMPAIPLGQAADVVCKSLNENPKDRRKAGSELIIDALAKAYPCGKK